MPKEYMKDTEQIKGEEPEVSIRLVIDNIEIPSLSGRGADNEVPLWDGIVGREVFPSTEESASYQLTLKKRAARAGEVCKVEAELEKALNKLSHVWHFAGGTMLIPEKTMRQQKELYVSNAKQVEEKLLCMEGMKMVYKDFSYGRNIKNAYRCTPLAHAKLLCEKVADNIKLQKLLKYYYDGIVDGEKWYIHLYKVRDVLRKILGKNQWRDVLSIEQSDLSDFKKILDNNDLRHADVSAIEVEVPEEEITRVKNLARTWVEAYLRHLGLNPV